MNRIWKRIRSWHIWWSHPYLKLNREQCELLLLIIKIWEGNRELRFLQLFGNCTGVASARDIYFVTDSQLILGLKQTYDTVKK